jgi:hypothetical protein
VSALPNLEALALRWCDRAERAEVTRVHDRRVHVELVGPKVRDCDCDRLASLLTFRLLPLGVSVDVVARTLDPPLPSSYVLHGGAGAKLDRRVLDVLAESPLTRAQLAYRLRIGPKSPRQRALTNSLYRLHRVDHKVVLTPSERYELAPVAA